MMALNQEALRELQEIFREGQKDGSIHFNPPSKDFLEGVKLEEEENAKDGQQPEKPSEQPEKKS